MKNWRINLSWPENIKLEGYNIEYLYEDKDGNTKSSFHEAEALAALLLSEAASLNSNWWEDDWPKEARKTVAICVNTNDIFAWGCADAETITYDEIEEVYRYWAKDQRWGTAIWAIIRKKEMPQRPVEKKIREGGIWDLDLLKKEHELKANHYDGISHVFAQRKRIVYEAWCKEIGQEPLPYDGQWWFGDKGWQGYMASHPDWNNAAWQAADDAARKQWRIDNGYELQEPNAAK